MSWYKIYKLSLNIRTIPPNCTNISWQVAACAKLPAKDSQDMHPFGKHLLNIELRLLELRSHLLLHPSCKELAVPFQDTWRSSWLYLPLLPSWALVIQSSSGKNRLYRSSFVISCLFMYIYRRFILEQTHQDIISKFSWRKLIIKYI